MEAQENPQQEHAHMHRGRPKVRDPLTSRAHYLQYQRDYYQAHRETLKKRALDRYYAKKGAVA